MVLSKNISLIFFTSLILISKAEAFVVVDAYDRGWWSSSVTNNPTNENYIVGRSSFSVFRNFFSFDLSGLSETVVSGKLELSAYDIVLSQLREYKLFDVETNVSILNQPGLPDGTIFEDLGSGVNYGALGIEFPSGAYYEDLIFSVVLNDAGIQAINSAKGGLFAIGGDLLEVEGDSEYLFGGSGGELIPTQGVQRLVLETSSSVPEPATMALFGMGMAGVLIRKRKR